jgi:two-component system sensor histidine kinase TctE
MTSQLRSAASIRRQLFSTLFVPVAALLVVGTVSDYLTALPPLTDAYDQALLDSALAIAAHVKSDAHGQLELSLPPDALAVLRADSQDSIFFRVSSADGRFIAGDVDLPQLPSSAPNPANADSVYRDQPVRIVSYRTLAGNDALTVTMGETTHKRAQTRNRILTSALATDVALLSAILALIWIGVRVSLEPLRNVGDQIARRSARDLTPLAVERVPTEIRRIVIALNRLFRLVSENAARQRQFLDNAAHQLRTPLAGIQAQLELLCADEPALAQRERLQRILDGARRLGHTTHQLLILARADESASPDWDFEEVDLASIVESIVGESIAAAGEAGIDLGADVREATVPGVGWLIAEALRSLANNALAHTPAGGSVTVGCGQHNGAPFVEVVDTGVGIPANERARVRERFFRASNAHGSGSGLGLAIVDEVTQLHRGELTIDSGPNGKGTAVRISFPAAGSVRDAQPAADNTAPSEAVRARPAISRA